MNANFSDESDDWINLLDLDSIADSSDKLAECEYFLGLATQEKDKEKFRWLISAFFGAAYSFFEINALCAYQRFHDPITDNPIADENALTTLRCYVRVVQNAKCPNYVKTAGQHDITNALYKFRKANTHHYPLSIMTASQILPEGFQFGNLSGKGVPALAFCRKAMGLIHEVERELQQIY